MIAQAALFIFPILMAIAGSSDLLTMTISNRISIALLLGFLAMAAILGLPLKVIALDVSCGAVILAITFAFFSMNWIGGGDAKLAAATAVWLGWQNILDYGLVASILGGALTLLLLTVRFMPLPSWAGAPWLVRLHDPRTGIPYGIALAVSGLVVFPETQIWLLAMGGAHR